VSPSSKPPDGKDAVRRTLQRIRRFFGSDQGPTAVEYAVLLALILLTVTSGVQTLGCNVKSTLDKASQQMGQ
jgi:pilus assembly protein Flp/PilA